MAQSKILIIEDDRDIREGVGVLLMCEDYEVLEAEDGARGLALLDDTCDLVILDVMMPGMDGYEVCRKVRESSQIPIIMLTARAEEIDTVLGLEMGADEYVTKPFSMRELMARVRTALRRYQALTKPDGNEDEIIKVGDFVLDTSKFSAERAGEHLDLTQRETEILKLLMLKKGQIFSRSEILEKVWGYQAFGDERTVDVTIRRLREKIEKDSSNPQYIKTKRGVGYYFSDTV